MHWSNIVVAAATVLGVAVNSVLFIVFYQQLRTLRRQVQQAEAATNRDHVRRRQQSTMEFLAATWEKRAVLREHVPYDLDAGAIADFIKRTDTSARERKLAVDYLSIWELLATGVNMEVFDVDIVERMAGVPIREISRNYSSFIEDRRRRFNAPNMYAEVTTLASVLEGRSSPHADGSGEPADENL